MGTWGDGPLITGLELRYVLTWHLVEAGSVLSVGELVRAVEADGFVVAGHANKTVSDALRWEIGRGRVVRVGWGRYRSGAMPRQTKSRIGRRVHTLRRRAFAARWDIPGTSPAGLADHLQPPRPAS